MGNHSAFLNNKSKKESLCNIEKILCQKADLIITSSKGLYNRNNCYSKNKVALVPNAVEFELFCKAAINNNILKPKELIGNCRKVVGYFREISNWFNVDLLIYVAENYHI